MPEAMITADLDAIVCEIDIAEPPERVFHALTDDAQLVRWFTGAECPVKIWHFQAYVVGRYHYHTEKGSMTINGINEFECQGEILEFQPPRLLVYTWVANWHAEQERTTVVRWDLTPDGSGTHVKVTHSGLAGEEVARKDYSGGWPGVLESLRKFSEQ